MRSTFEDATELEYKVACVGTGLQTTLEQKAEVLFSILQVLLIRLMNCLRIYYEARFIEKDYLSIREDFSVRAFFDATSPAAGSCSRKQPVMMAQWNQPWQPWIPTKVWQGKSFSLGVKFKINAYQA